MEVAAKAAGAASAAAANMSTTPMHHVPTSLGLGFYFLPLATVICFLIPVLYLFPPIPATPSDALLATHSKIGVAPPKSNLQDQYSAAHREDHPGAAAAAARLHALCVYPIKSCRGIEMAKSKLLPTGLEFDRLYTFAQLKSAFPVAVDDSDEAKDEHSWEFVTQRQFPLLATVKVDVYVPDATKSTVFTERSGDAWIVFRFPWQDRGFAGLMQWVAAKVRDGWRALPVKEVLLPVEYPSAKEIEQRGYTHENVRVWKELVPALNMAKEIPNELRLYLGVSNKLAIFRVDPGHLRLVYRCAPRKEEAGYKPAIRFQDAYPLHLMNLSSLREFDSQVPKDEDLQQLDVRRFRSNIVLSGAPAYDEESWKYITFTQGTSKSTIPVKFQVSCRTVRCKLPNVDPATGIRHKVEPDRSLRKLREVDEGAPKMGCLGMQMCPLFEGIDRVEYMQAWLEVGMEVHVQERGQHVYIKS